MTQIGTVYLVGAGPGDPDLMTVKGLNVLRRADVVIYDRLAPPELLREARADAELIDAGKQPEKHRLDQQTINDVMIQKAQEGHLVVRLKGGDPFVFGRGGEEALACYAAGVPVVVVPGISSAIAVPAYAGIPVTQRGINATFTVISAHENPDSEANSLDYAALAKMQTLIILMGVKQLQNVVEKLLAAGMSSQTPAACIEWGTTPKQRVVQAPLGDIYSQALNANIQSPAITIIGNVVSLRNAGLAWFTPSGDSS